MSDKKNNDNYWSNKGITFYRQGKYKKAIKCFDEAVKLKPDNDNYWNNKGKALKKAGKYEEALKCYDKAIKLNPDNYKCFNNKGNVFYKLGKHEEFYRGNSLVSIRRYYKEALECYDKAIKFNLDNDKYLNNKGNALKKLGKYKEALECYDKAIKLNPNNDKCLNNKGNALYTLRNDKEALECYKKAIDLNPDNDKYWNSKGNALYALERYKEALECYKEAIEIYPCPAYRQKKDNVLEKIRNDEEYNNVDFEILPSGNIDRELNAWIGKHSRNEKEYKERHNIINFLKNFKPIRTFKSKWSREEDYIIMVFDKKDIRVVIAESGIYGDATYCYITESFDDKDWKKVFKLDKQRAQKYKGVIRISHDHYKDLYNWKSQIEAYIKFMTLSNLA